MTVVMVMDLRRLRDLREDNDLKQRELARVLGVATNTYSQYENGLVTLTAEALCVLADFYGTSIDYLLSRTDERTPYPGSRRPKL